MTDDEEKECVEKLNRNIRSYRTNNHKRIRSKKKDDIYDLDRYFSQFIDKRIKTKEEQSNINPIDFKK